MIYGERIRFRAAERDDIPTFARWLNDPEVRQGISIYYPMSLAQEERWFDKMLERPQDEQPHTIEVKEGDDWVTIGNCGLFDFDQRSRSAEFGIMIGEKAYWNRGYGTEATRLLLHHAFDTLNLNRVHLRAYETNPRAIRAYEKAGFTHEGRLRQGEFQDGKYIDVLLMSILQSEWAEAQKSNQDE